MRTSRHVFLTTLTLIGVALSQDVSGTTKFQSSNKRGLIYITSDHPSDAQIWVENNSDLTWYYDYSDTPAAVYSNLSQEEFEFVPMLWGPTNSSGFASEIQSQIISGRNITHILTFNEPDGASSTGGSEIMPADAASIWIKDIEPLRNESIRIGAPSVTGSQSGLTWLSEFFSNCTALKTNCTVDFIPLHWYGDFQGLASYLGQVVAAYPNTSIWITEYALANADLKDTQAFFQTSAEYFDRLDYIERYSYFGSFRSSVSNVGPNAAMLTQDGQLTDIGSWYLGGAATGNVPSSSSSSSSPTTSGSTGVGYKLDSYKAAYCLIFEDDFLNGISENDWNYEIQVGGYGVGSFDWTTNDPSNAYTDENGLHIVPTITTNVTDITNAQLLNGYTLNLTQQGVCTAADSGDCVRVSNITTSTIINPVRSARLTTKGKHNITYGKIEVKAKLPRGDWLWPAIWMMPEEDVYGSWPLSGEIDIMESKGNDGRTYDGGRNLVGGTLHWAPNAVLDAFYRTTGVKYMTRGDYSDDYHTFGMEWSDEYIYTWVDSRLAQSMYIPFGKKYGTMYERGHFSSMSVNGSIPLDPWSGTKRYNTPFDQAFYLIMNVAVGSTNSYFQDGYGSKPWIDGSDDAMAQFYNASSAWESTWGEGDTRGMSVKSVKIFQRGNCPSS
ncbi:hypothetical protein TCE0_022f06912 [Talaromyces pinophilus]|uniref:GH16 domain-containing protein n=1 Tax=Talaromyces pinophilus TaxID=128442 RepID=A0A6V8H7N8_TALPI|nr:Concanavalin A-like lectin/glucanase, subgroup [Penicillium occitanis (nom. inval.)]PCG95097.1 hypothetical protein PENOC_079400 [Penicillium occitanis (nom. inval.)]GAM37197.1 hypothetical protein TCE0_022f06912 [Talaromyces pinophilus]